MSKVLVTEDYLEDIADAIRAKNGGSATYKPGQMAAAIRDIPNSYNASDEGKVVIGGALVAQTARSSAITINGTYDTTENDSVTVSVPSGGATLQSKTVTPSASQQTVQPDSGYDGLSAVTVNGDADLVAENIKKDVEIFGVTGTYEGSGGGGGIYRQLSPLHENASNGYLSSANFYLSSEGNIRYDLYEITPGKRYIVHLDGTPGNRCRSASFATDPYYATGTLTGNSLLCEKDDPPAYYVGITVGQYNTTIRTIWEAPSNANYLVVQKSNQSQSNVKTYVVEVNV